MTIFNGKVVDGKNFTEKLDNSLIEETADDALVPLTEWEFGESKESLQLPGIKVVRDYKPDCKRRFKVICSVLGILTIFASAACLGYFMHKRLYNYKPFVDTVHVRFHEYIRSAEEHDIPESRIDGGFFEQVEIDWKRKQYEKISVPFFIDVKRATVVHDFVHMWTAIVDDDNSQCFVIPLNQSITFPPDIFMEYLLKHRDVYKVASFKVERQVHKVVTPPLPLENLLEFGDLIATDCHFYNTYKLVKADEPFAMSKRFACRFSGDTYSLGGTGYPALLLIVLNGCA